MSTTCCKVSITVNTSSYTVKIVYLDFTFCHIRSDEFDKCTYSVCKTIGYTILELYDEAFTNNVILTVLWLTLMILILIWSIVMQDFIIHERYVLFTKGREIVQLIYPRKCTT